MTPSALHVRTVLSSMTRTNRRPKTDSAYARNTSEQMVRSAQRAIGLVSVEPGGDAPFSPTRMHNTIQQQGC